MPQKNNKETTENIDEKKWNFMICLQIRMKAEVNLWAKLLTVRGASEHKFSPTEMTVNTQDNYALIPVTVQPKNSLFFGRVKGIL